MGKIWTGGEEDMMEIFIHSFTHSWSKDSLTTYSVVSIILGSGAISVSKTDMPGRLV